MKKIIHDPTYITLSILTAITITLLFLGFFFPPPGEIPQSVLKAACIIFGFATLFVAYSAIKRGIDARLTAGKFGLDLRNPDSQSTTNHTPEETE